MKSHSFFTLSNLSSILLSCLLVVTIAAKSYTQVPDKAQTMAYLNKLGGDSVRFSLKGVQLTIDLLDGNQKMLRLDKVMLTDLDTVASFESSSKLVCVNCIKGTPDCVNRELIVQKVRRNYDRISILTSLEKSAGYIAAIQHLIKITSVKKYKDEVLLPEY
jgi:hypothetical protein